MLEQIVELSRQGFACTQIMMHLVLDAEGKQNPELIRSLGALTKGLRNTGQLCGALTGGACIISYYACQGAPDEKWHPSHDEMIQELFAWFSTEMTQRWGGISCPELLDNGARKKPDVCPGVIVDTFNKTVELLETQGLLS